eukprot:TRINITY_DN102893_c0_g1_i1.p2 TRINITY_DN102893_c0_g1~~TRINITY_DN102893_c0_g1_i1.p2  ORF type:complete len:271 (-),score=42.35 TRINITY_DN102893_c0_g1_i1:1562-2374(-)
MLNRDGPPHEGPNRPRPGTSVAAILEPAKMGFEKLDESMEHVMDCGFLFTFGLAALRLIIFSDYVVSDVFLIFVFACLEFLKPLLLWRLNLEEASSSDDFEPPPYYLTVPTAVLVDWFSPSSCRYPLNMYFESMITKANYRNMSRICTQTGWTPRWALCAQIFAVVFLELGEWRYLGLFSRMLGPQAGSQPPPSTGEAYGEQQCKTNAWEWSEAGWAAIGAVGFLTYYYVDAWVRTQGTSTDRVTETVSNKDYLAAVAGIQGTFNGMQAK